MKHTHFKTPRTLNDAFGPYSEWSTKKREPIWAYLAACALVVAMVWMLCR